MRHGKTILKVALIGTLLWFAVPSACQSLLSTVMRAERIEVARIPAPDVAIDAVIVRVNSGATTAYAYELYIVKAGASPGTDTQNRLFAASHLQGEKFFWTEPRRLEIRYEKGRIYDYKNYWKELNGDAVEILLVQGTAPPAPRSDGGGVIQ